MMFMLEAVAQYHDQTCGAGKKYYSYKYHTHQTVHAPYDSDTKKLTLSKLLEIL